MISFVYAQDRHGGIGYQGSLPWDLPNDMKFFKETTMGHTIVMGRKTFEAMNQRLLPGRKTVVVTQQKNYGQDIEGLMVIHDLEALRELGQSTHLMVIGGAQLFAGLMDDVDEIIRTVIDASFPNDVVMEELNPQIWEKKREIEGIIDEKNHYPHRFQWWQRKEKIE